MQPTGYRVWIKPDYAKDHKVAGTNIVIEIAESDRTGVAAVTEGTVLAVGPTAFVFDKESAALGRRSPLNEPWCKVGDRVVFSKYGGKIIVDPKTEEKTIIINDQDVMMLLDQNDKVVESKDGNV